MFCYPGFRVNTKIQGIQEKLDLKIETLGYLPIFYLCLYSKFLWLNVAL